MNAFKPCCGHDLHIEQFKDLPYQELPLPPRATRIKESKVIMNTLSTDKRDFSRNDSFMIPTLWGHEKKIMTNLPHGTNIPVRLTASKSSPRCFYIRPYVSSPNIECISRKTYNDSRRSRGMLP